VVGNDEGVAPGWMVSALSGRISPYVALRANHRPEALQTSPRIFMQPAGPRAPII